MSNKNVAQEWAERCAKSNGSMIMLPTELIKDADEFLAKREEFASVSREYDKKNAEYEMLFKQFWFSLRQKLEEKGVAYTWGKNVGLNEHALQDGVKIINITVAQ